MQAPARFQRLINNLPAASNKQPQPAATQAGPHLCRLGHGVTSQEAQQGACEVERQGHGRTPLRRVDKGGTKGGDRHAAPRPPVGNQVGGRGLGLGHLQTRTNRCMSCCACIVWRMQCVARAASNKPFFILESVCPCPIPTSLFSVLTRVRMNTAVWAVNSRVATMPTHRMMRILSSWSPASGWGRSQSNVGC